MSKHRFNAARCKRAIERISAGYQGASDVIDDLILDIEDLHRKAQERDQILEAIDDLAHGSEHIYPDDLYSIYDCYTNEKGDLDRTADLVL